MKAGTGDALETISARKERDLRFVKFTPTAPSSLHADVHPRVTRMRASMLITSTNTIDYYRRKRQMNEFEQIGETNNNANGTYTTKAKNFFNKIMDAFDELMAKIQKMVKSSETDGTIATKAK